MASRYQIAWERREKRYTRRYTPQVYAVLSKIWRRAAKTYAESQTFEVTDADFLPVYKRIYDQVGLAEATLTINSMPQEKGKKDIIDAIANLFITTGDQATIRFVRELMQQYFDVYIMQRLQEVTETTRRQIQLSIQEGIDQGLGSAEIAKAIRKRAPEINKTRSVRIARTETVTAANKAQLLSHEASPFVYQKAWLPVVDDRTRPGHIAMNANNFIDLWDYFQVRSGDGVIQEMLAPGDTGGDASNVVNCRCVMRFKAKKGADGRLIRKNSIQ